MGVRSECRVHQRCNHRGLVALILILTTKRLELTGTTVDGGSWRTQSNSPGSAFTYPDFLLSDEVVTGVRGMKKVKAKL